MFLNLISSHTKFVNIQRQEVSPPVLKNTVFITDAIETIINQTNQNLNYSDTLDIIW